MSLDKSESFKAIYISKSWGKSPVLHCIFEKPCGEQVKFACFKPNNTTRSGVYTPKDGGINLNDKTLFGKTFELETRETTKGREYLYRAILID